LKLSVIVVPLTEPDTEIVLVETEALGGVPSSVSTWALPLRLSPDVVHWMKMTCPDPVARYPVPTAPLPEFPVWPFVDDVEEARAPRGELDFDAPVTMRPTTAPATMIAAGTDHHQRG
jgi:hypothetical protein